MEKWFKEKSEEETMSMYVKIGNKKSLNMSCRSCDGCDKLII